MVIFDWYLDSLKKSSYEFIMVYLGLSFSLDKLLIKIVFVLFEFFCKKRR